MKRIQTLLLLLFFSFSSKAQGNTDSIYWQKKAKAAIVQALASFPSGSYVHAEPHSTIDTAGILKIAQAHFAKDKEPNATFQVGEIYFLNKYWYLHGRNSFSKKGGEFELVATADGRIFGSNAGSDQWGTMGTVTV